MLDGLQAEGVDGGLLMKGVVIDKGGGKPKGIFFSEAMEQFEKCFILEVVSRHDGNLLRAAERLKIHRNTLAKRLSRFKTARK